MAYFHNRTVNLVNLHYVISAIAMGGGGAFFTVYVLKAGVGVPAALLAFAAMFALRLVLRFMLLPFGIRFGLRRLVIVGTLLMAISFPFLAGVHGLGAGLLALVVVSALADTVYWPSYHAYFAAVGDAEHRGQQLGVREALTAALGIVTPLLFGWLLVVFGARVAFFATGAVQALSAIPILFTQDVPIAPHAPGAFKAAIGGAMLFVGDGFVAAGYVVVWQMALFVALGENFLAYGGALAVAALVGAVGGLVLGRLIDQGKGGGAVWYSIGLLVLVIAMRTSVLHNPALAVVANALGALVGCLYVPTMMTAVYNQAKRSPCVLRFHIAAEGGWDIGVTIALTIAAAITWLGYSIGWGIALSLFGAAFVFVLLQRYYAAHPFETVAAHEPGEFQSQPAEAPRM
jgi:DHA1 family inner membrane transport protein